MFSIQLGNSESVELEVVSKEPIYYPRTEVFVSDKSERIRILSGTQRANKSDSFIRYKSCGLSISLDSIIP